MSIKVQEAPQAPSYAAANIQVPANIATPQATMDGIKAQQSQLNAVNSLTGGRHRRSTKRQERSRQYKHKSFIRTYKGRRYHNEEQQQKGGAGDIPDGRIPVPQVGSTCASGPQCSGVQNANLTALYNQAQSNSINDGYMKTGGGRRRHRDKKITFRQRPRVYHHKTKYDTLSTISYNIKKVFRKIFT